MIIILLNPVLLPFLSRSIPILAFVVFFFFFSFLSFPTFKYIINDSIISFRMKKKAVTRKVGLLPLTVLRPFLCACALRIEIVHIRSFLRQKLNRPRSIARFPRFIFSLLLLIIVIINTSNDISFLEHKWYHAIGL